MPPNVFGQKSGYSRVLSGVTVRRSTSALLVFAVLFPAIIAFGVLYRDALSVPYQDDYKAILAFVLDYDKLSTLKTKVLEIVTAQHNEYKLGFEHSIVASEMELTHHLNFAFLISLGNFFLLPIGYLLWRTHQADESDLNSRLLYFLPISFLFFSLTYWENLNWAMAGLQNIPVVLFSLLAVYFLAPRQIHPTRAHLLLGCVAGALAAFASANGFLLVPVGLLILLPRRAYAGSLVWCASFVMPLAAYLYHYTHSVQAVHRYFYITRPLFFLGFLGCAISSPWIAALVGVGILIICFHAVRSRFDQVNPVAFYFTVWLMATACLVAWVRGASGFGIASRYSMYSVLLLIFCYSVLAHLVNGSHTFNQRGFFVVSIVLAIGIFFMADLSAHKNLGVRRRMVLAGIELYRAKPEANSPMVDPRVEKLFPEEKAFEQGILTESIQKGIYALPPKQEIR
jgi:hypothetical protein